MSREDGIKMNFNPRELLKSKIYFIVYSLLFQVVGEDDKLFFNECCSIIKRSKEG